MGLFQEAAASYVEILSHSGLSPHEIWVREASDFSPNDTPELNVILLLNTLHALAIEQ